MDNGV